jgi:16S rRNA C1402 (ribose-2'-O) methylase RsmI
VAAVRAAGFEVIPVPGPNAAIAALSASGLTDPHFLFYGFLPTKEAARRKAIAALKPRLPCALVFYEAPHRIEEAVADLAAELLEPQRTLVIARELTKLFESDRQFAAGRGAGLAGGRREPPPRRVRAGRLGAAAARGRARRGRAGARPAARPNCRSSRR